MEFNKGDNLYCSKFSVSHKGIDMEFSQKEKEKEGSPKWESNDKEGYKDKGIKNGLVEMEKRQER